VSRLELTTTGASAVAVALSANNPHLAIMRDGSGVVYLGGEAGTGPGLFLRRLDQLEPTRLTERAFAPFVSPDGEWVGFFDGSRMKKVAITGGPVLDVASVDGATRGAIWGADDSIVFSTANLATGLLRVPAAGGSPVVLTRPDRTGDHVRPSLLPDDRGVLFTIAPAALSDRNNVQVAMLDLRTPGATPKILIRGVATRDIFPPAISSTSPTTRCVSCDSISIASKSGGRRCPS
jgi:hypothetical protein